MTSINKVSIISHHFRANPTAPERQAGRVSQAGHSGGLSWDELAALRGRGLNRDNNWLHGLLLLCNAHAIITQFSPNGHAIITQFSYNYHPILMQLSPNAQSILT